jgi:hypothetical protein
MPRYMILTKTLFTERDWQRFGCAEFAAAGYEVVPVELGRALVRAAAVERRAGFRSREGAREIPDIDVLDQFLGTVTEKDVVLVEARLSSDTRPLFRLLGKHRIRYVAVDLGVLPLIGMRGCRAARSLGEYVALRLEDFGGLLHRCKRLLAQMVSNRFEYFRLQSPSVWITAGNATSWFNANLPQAWKARRISAPSFDSMTAAALAGRSAEPRPVAVFLDEAFDDHPDFQILGTSAPVTAERYWTALESVFRALETKTGLHVVIAPHPKTSGEAPDFIKVRMAEVGRTAELVRDSAVVLCHASTAVSFAVLFRKPLVFLTTNEIERSPYRGAIARMSSWFASRRINADDFRPEELSTPPVDERRYRAYEHAFLRAPDAAGSPWELLRARTFAIGA